MFSNIGDVEEPRFLQSAAFASSNSFRELTLLLSLNTTHSSHLMAVNSTKRMQALGMPVLTITDRRDACVELPNCYWSSNILENPPADSIALRKFWDGRFRTYFAKKDLAARLSALGFSVLQVDSDVIWHKNPFPLLRTLPKRCSLLVQKDHPFANAGMLFAPAFSKEGQHILNQVAWRVKLMQQRPSAVKYLAEFASMPYFGNSDDQTSLNDVIMSSVTGVRSFFAQARQEAKSRYNKESKVDWNSLLEKNEMRQLVHQTATSARRIQWNASQIVIYPLKNSSRAICLAPSTLFGHFHDHSNYAQHLAGARGKTKALLFEQRMRKITG